MIVRKKFLQLYDVNEKNIIHNRQKFGKIYLFKQNVQIHDDFPEQSTMDTNNMKNMVQRGST